MIGIDELKRNIDRVENSLIKACDARGISRSDITLIPATKTQPIERIREYSALTGATVFGENRVQEFISKYTSEFTWHMIGQLQSNKVKQVVDKTALIHSVDRLSLAEEIDRCAKRAGLVANVLIEVNIGEEEAKGGLRPDEVCDFIGSLTAFSGLAVEGIMSVLPNEPDVLRLNAYYERLERLYERVKHENPDVKYLSAGMSGDYETAIAHGANMIRLGSAIFGPRI